MNVFKNYIAEDCFRFDIVDRVFRDWKNSRKEGYVFTKDKAYDALIDFFSGFEFTIEEFVDEEFADEEKTEEN